MIIRKSINCSTKAQYCEFHQISVISDTVQAAGMNLYAWCLVSECR
jgi:hypothetical protein